MQRHARILRTRNIHNETIAVGKTVDYIEHSCLRIKWPYMPHHCPTSRKFVGSIPDEVIGIFH
jgi:hypothetical protein